MYWLKLLWHRKNQLRIITVFADFVNDILKNFITEMDDVLPGSANDYGDAHYSGVLSKILESNKTLSLALKLFFILQTLHLQDQLQKTLNDIIMETRNLENLNV